VAQNRLRGCVLRDDKTLGKTGRGSYDGKHDVKTCMSLVKWYDNKAVSLASSYVDAYPVDKCRRRWNERKSMWKSTGPTLSRSMTQRRKC